MNTFETNAASLHLVEANTALSILSAMSRARLIGRFKVEGEDTTQRVKIETTQDAAHLATLLTARGLRVTETDLSAACPFPAPGIGLPQGALPGVPAGPSS